MQLFHIAELADIPVFMPRPAPAYAQTIERAVVFGIDDRLLHTYLLPGDCPRVAFYATSTTLKPIKKSSWG